MASTKILVHQDFNKNEIQNAAIQNLASAPSSPVEGQIYHDTVSHASFVWNGSAWRPVDAAKLTDGTIANTALATNPLARANHTGTQTASTISDFDTQVRTSTLNQMAAPSADLSINSHKLTNVATPTAANDAANKQYVDDTVAAISWKDEVAAATTANITLSGEQTIDGFTTSASRVLVKDQSTASQNGIYVSGSGAWTRATDADSDTDIKGAAVYVANGTTNGGSRFVCNVTGTIVIGTTAITFASFGGGSTYTAGNGLQLSGSAFSVVADTGISVSGSGVAVNTSVVARKYSASIGDNSSTSFTVNHALSNQWVTVQVFQVASPFAMVIPAVELTDANNCTIKFNSAPTTNQYKVVVTG